MYPINVLLFNSYAKRSRSLQNVREVIKDEAGNGGSGSGADERTKEVAEGTAEDARDQKTKTTNGVLAKVELQIAAALLLARRGLVIVVRKASEVDDLIDDEDGQMAKEAAVHGGGDDMDSGLQIALGAFTLTNSRRADI